MEKLVAGKILLFKNYLSKNKNIEADFILSLFQFQASNNEIYKSYLKLLNISANKIKKVSDIPFLPILFFKTQKITCGQTNKELCVFESSSTTGQIPSRHFVFDSNFYFKHAQVLFENEFGSLKDFQIYALLPSYLEKGNSSLVAMVEYFMKATQHNENQFFGQNYEELYFKMGNNNHSKKKKLLIGVSYALWEFAESYPISLKDWIVMETGGMKGRKKEIVREELHEILKTAFQIEKIASEYGMTELFSQAYSKGDGIYKLPYSMKILVRDLSDPFSLSQKGWGGMNIIDLANIDSCAFIETQDIVRIYPEESKFEVLGRIDHSDLRGCNLMQM